jgi:hypothetical protein
MIKEYLHILYHSQTPPLNFYCQFYLIIDILSYEVIPSISKINLKQLNIRPISLIKTYEIHRIDRKPHFVT